MRVVGDAAETLARVPDGGAGLVITDPPWALAGGGKFEDCASYARLTVAECAEALTDARRALKPGAHLYVFAPAGDALLDVGEAFRAHGWHFLRALSWDKGGAGGIGAYRNAWEPILIFSNGKSRGFERHCEFPSLLKFRADSRRTQKPWGLYRVALEMSSRPGELVVDPFCGTNPLEKAAAHVHPSRRWLAGDVATAEAVADDVRPRSGAVAPASRAIATPQTSLGTLDGWLKGRS